MKAKIALVVALLALAGCSAAASSSSDSSFPLTVPAGLTCKHTGPGWLTFGEPGVPVQVKHIDDARYCGGTLQDLTSQDKTFLVTPEHGAPYLLYSELPVKFTTAKPVST